MREYWREAFPPLTQPLQFFLWLVTVHTGQLFSYPAGGAGEGSGAMALLCFVVGVIFLVRRRRGEFLGLCLTPFALTLVAAAMQRYPYGGFARTSQHLAPAICLLAGLGAARLLARLPRPAWQHRGVLALLSIFVIFAGGTLTHDLAHPYRTEHDLRVREFARWFWADKAIDAELVCTHTDLNQQFFRKSYLWRGIAQYLCNQRIYSPRHAAHRDPPDLDSISSSRALRCVVFSRPGLSRDEAAFSNWLLDMQRRMDWVGYERNDFYKPHDHGPDIERIEVFEFAPHNKVAGTDTMLRPQLEKRAVRQESN